MPDESSGTDRGGTERGSPTSEAIRIEPLQTVLLSDSHRTADFRCANSKRINDFFGKECPEYCRRNYCRVFVLPNPKDPNEIWGYYTLSPSIILRDRMTRSDRDSLIIRTAPVMHIGFMGKHDGTAKGLGESLLVDAARRVYCNPDLAAWGLTLDSENGPENPKLWAWYQQQGFKPAKPETDHPKLGHMYAGPLQKLIPELKR